MLERLLEERPSSTRYSPEAEPVVRSKVRPSALPAEEEESSEDDDDEERDAEYRISRVRRKRKKGRNKDKNKRQSRLYPELSELY